MFDLYHLRLFGRTLRLGLITTVVCVSSATAGLLAGAGPAAGADLGLFLLDHAADGQRGDPGVRLDRDPRAARASSTRRWSALGLDPVKLLYTETAVVIGLVNIFMPFMVLPLMAAIERIPPSLEEAARNLGANWWQMFRRTILPLSLPGLISGCLLVYSRVDQRLRHAGADGQRARAHGRPADL